MSSSKEKTNEKINEEVSNIIQDSENLDLCDTLSEKSGDYRAMIRRRNARARVTLGSYRILTIACDRKEKMYHFFYLDGDNIVQCQVNTEGRQNGSESIYPYLGKKAHVTGIKFKTLGESCVVVEEIHLLDQCMTYKVVKELRITEKDMICIML